MIIGVFFFQAEDGIRDRLVTGVQTCALPICLRFWWSSVDFVSQDDIGKHRALEEFELASARDLDRKSVV